MFRAPFFWIVVLSVLCSATFAIAMKKAAPTDDATLSSDEMEIINQGSKTVFTGHVLLEKTPYELRAKRMSRIEKSGLVEAEGNIIGTWKGPTSRLDAYGDHARYDTQSEIAELWTNLPKQVAVNWKDAKGSGDFLSDRAILHVSSKTVRLADHVTGHIVPAQP